MASLDELAKRAQALADALHEKAGEYDHRAEELSGGDREEESQQYDAASVELDEAGRKAESIATDDIPQLQRQYEKVT